MRYKEFRLNAQSNDVDHNGNKLGEVIVHGVYIDPNYVHITSKPGVASSNVNSTARVTIPETHPFFNLDICSDTVDNLVELDDSIFFGPKWERSISNIVKEWFPTVFAFHTKR